MKKSIRFYIVLICTIMVVITYITTIIALCGIGEIQRCFELKNLTLLFIVLIFNFIISSLLSKSISFPLKKLEKNMNVVADGKIPNTKQLKEYTKFSEFQDVITSYRAMIEVIKKNNFDLNSQQSKTEIILEHMADGVVAFSVTEEVIHINKSAMRLLNLEHYDDTFTKICKKLKIDLEFDKIMYLPNYKSIEVKASVNDNYLNIVFVPFFSDRLSPMGVIMMVRNITENVRLDNMRKEFVANVSHELKTPLTSIKGYSETILNGGLTEAEIQKFSKVINTEANRMDRLVADLLQLSRFDYKRINFKKMMFSLDVLALSVCDKLKYLASEKKHKLECEVLIPPPNVYADKDAIEQVIINIVTNSIKYTKDGGIIKIYVGAINGRAYFKVVDNGIGIPEQDLKRIFERFYRVDKARSRSMGGTGLGLSIVKEIVDGNDGTIDIKSEVGKGTEVIVTLPTKIKDNASNKKE